VDSQAAATLEVEVTGAAQARTWIGSVIGLLEVASRQVEHNREAARSTIERATSLLEAQMQPRTRTDSAAVGRLLAWQVRKVRDYVDAHITGRVLVSDLSAKLQLSEGHFSRSFKRTFGISPHAFVLHRRLELAAHLMLASPASLTDIALRCGFTDQAHFCHQFRKSTGESPAAWRRARRDERFFIGQIRRRRTSDRWRAGPDAQLEENALGVRLDGLGSNTPRLSDPLVGQSLGDHP
jgi:AraC family transcriptional regulator